MALKQDKKTIITTIIKQLENFLNIAPCQSKPIIMESIDEALDKLFTILNRMSHEKKYVYENGESIFNNLNTDHNAMFLYLLSNTISKQYKNKDIATGLYYLNKIMHSIDVFYEVELPKYFGFGHCVGTVLGRAIYSNYFGVMHNCTVGNNLGIYPVFDEHVSMLVGSKVIGDCRIGENTIISANTFIRDEDIPKNSIVFGATPNLIIKPNNVSLYLSKWKK